MSAEHRPPSQRRVRLPVIQDDTGPDDTVARLRGVGRYAARPRSFDMPEPPAIDRHAAAMSDRIREHHSPTPE